RFTGYRLTPIRSTLHPRLFTRCKRTSLTEGDPVENPFDIMKVLNDDRLAWVEAANELSAARLRICELLADSPGEYIVFNQETKQLVSHFTAWEPVESLLGLEEDVLEPLQPEMAVVGGDFFQAQPELAATL